MGTTAQEGIVAAVQMWHISPPARDAESSLPDSVLQGLVPVLGVDIWEHAYYKQYNNLRPEYLKNIWKIINWKDVDERLRAAKA